MTKPTGNGVATRGNVMPIDADTSAAIGIAEAKFVDLCNAAILLE